MQGHGHLHAAVEISYDRGEYRLDLQTGNSCHLRQMLVCLGQTVLSGTIQIRCTIRALILGNHLFAAAGIARQRKAGKRRICRQDARHRQRCHQADKTAGMASGNSHTAAFGDGLPMLLGELCKSIGPAIRNTMGSRGIQDPCSAALCQGNGFLRCSVRQTQHRKICRVDCFLPCSRILPKCLGQGQQFQIRPGCQTLKNTQTRGAFLAVNKYLHCHEVMPPWLNLCASGA